MSKSINWTLGNQQSFTATEIGEQLTIQGYKENDFVITKNEAGQLVLTDAKEGTLSIDNWNESTLQSIQFIAGEYNKTLVKNDIDAQLFEELTLANTEGEVLVYDGGSDVRQQFDINFSTSTNIVIDSVSGTEDRIRFTNNWSVNNIDIQYIGNDLYIKNWDPETFQVIDGQVIIRNFMNSSVKTVEFGEQTYHLVTGGDSNYVGSDTIVERYVFLDNIKRGNDLTAGNWNVTIAAGNNDVLDLHFLPNNRDYYSWRSQVDGQDMVLTYRYYIAALGDDSATLGTIRLKNYFNEDGSINTANGNIRFRTNREFYKGDDIEPGWVRITGRSEDKNYRWLDLSAGTAGADEVDLADLVKPHSSYGWQYFAGEGNDSITAHAGDIVYGDAGDDTLYATERLTDVHGGWGNDTILIRGKNGENVSYAVARGEGGNDVINAYGSYHYIGGNFGDDEIHLRSAKGDENLAHGSMASGGLDNDKIYIHAGYKHRINGGKGDDKLYAYLGDDHILSGGPGEDEIHIIDDGTKRSSSNKAYGGDGNDKLYIENGGIYHSLFGDAGDDYLSVEGNDNVLYGDTEDDELTVVDGTNNKLYGGDGNDTMTILSGDDNELHGDAGNDKLYGGSGNDKLYGNDGDDEIYGGSGNDKLYGDAGADVLYGGAGNDLLAGNNGNDVIYGDAGDDTLYGNAGDDMLVGGKGNDVLYGGAGKDTFVYANGDGNDVIKSYDSGKDTIEVTGGTIGKVELANAGQDVVLSVGEGSITLKNAAGSTLQLKDSRGSYTASGTAVTLGSDFAGTVKAESYLDTVVKIDGSSAAGKLDITGNVLDNEIYGGSVNDKLYGGDGADVLYGGAGNDLLAGNNGNDVIYGDAGYDTLYGNAGDDMLVGGTGNDVLYGGAGRDTFVYANGDGNDVIKGYDTGKDTIEVTGGTIGRMEAANAGQDVVLSVGEGCITLENAAGSTLQLKDSRGSYTASGTAVTLGSDFAGTVKVESYLDTVVKIDGSSAAGKLDITGNDLDNEIHGGSGNDRLYGGDGADVLYGGAGNDLLSGNNGNDLLYGDTGDDTLYGNAGDDTLVGGTGNDVLYGGAGKDTFVYANGDGNDVIKSYDSGKDTIEVTGGTIGTMELANAGLDVLLSVGGGSMTLENAAGSTLQLKDSRGSYTASKTGITLGANFIGTMDVANYLSTVKIIDGSSTGGGITIKDNTRDNIIYGGGGNDIIYTSSGTNYINAGAGENIFRFSGSGWKATIEGASGSDLIDLSNYYDDIYEMSSFYREGDDFKAAFKTSWDNEITGSFTIRDYFRSEDRIANLIWYNHFTSWSAGEESGEVEELNVVVSDDNANADISGTAGNDLIISGNGDKTVFAGAGNDKIHVGWKDSVNYTESFGNQVINAGPGNDTIWVEDFVDGSVHELNGGDGDDLIYTWEDQNVLNGDGGDDNLQASGTGHKLYGGEGNDQLFAGGTDNELYGGTGNDWINVNGDNNIVNGDDGKDNLYSYGNANTLNGGDGNDEIAVYIFDKEEFTSTDNNVINGGAGDDTIRVGYSFGDYYEGNFNSISGGSGKDTIHVPGNNNTVNGDDDDDYLDVAGDSNVINGGSGGDTVSVEGNATTINGYNGNDTLRVTGNNNYVNGGAGQDDIFVTGDNNKINGDSGEDRIYIEGGQGNVSQGGDDDDMMWISDGTNNTLYGDSGNDSLSVDGGNGHTLVGGLGADCYSFDTEITEDTRLTINQRDYDEGYADTLMLLFVNKEDVNYSLEDGTLTITHSSGGTITVEGWDVNPLSDITFGRKHDGYIECITVTREEINEALGINDEPGNDIIFEGDETTINGHGGNDTLKITGNNNIVNGGAGNDTINVQGNKNSVNGQNGHDTISVSGNENQISGDEGNNEIILSDGDDNIIYCFDGSDTIKIEGGAATRIESGGGNDTIILSGGSIKFTQLDEYISTEEENYIYAEGGDDTIQVTGGDGYLIYCGYGDDTVIVDHAINNMFMMGGEGSDTYIINSLVSEGGTYFVEQYTYEYDNSNDKDILQLPNVSVNDIDYDIYNDTLHITHKNGGVVMVNTWGDAPLSQVVFTDGAVTGTEINEILDEKLHAVYTGTEGQDVFTFSGTDWDITIAGADSNDIIDLSNYGGYTFYDYGDFTKTGNDLKATFASESFSGQREDAVVIGAVTIQDYYNTEDKISNVVWYNFRNPEGEEVESIHVIAGSDNDNTIYGTDGRDLIVTGGGNSTADAGNGNDVLVIKNLEAETDMSGNTITVRGGFGSDRYDIAVLPEGMNVIIDQQDFSFGDEDKLNLLLFGEADVQANLDENNIMYLTANGFGTVSITNWNTNPLDTIHFSDGTISGKYI